MHKAVDRLGYIPARARRGAPPPRREKGEGRGATALRILAAVPGGYAVASLATACLARLVPGDRAAATVTATLASFAVLAGVIVLSFSLRSVLRLWLILIAIAAVTGGATWLSVALGGRL
jgi:hypothetical protein